MEGMWSVRTPVPRISCAIWYKKRAVVIPEEVIAQICAAPTETLGWFEEELGQAWKQPFPITPTSIIIRDLPLDHNAWNLTPNPWRKFLTDTPAISWEATEELSKQRWPSIVPY